MYDGTMFVVMLEEKIDQGRDFGRSQLTDSWAKLEQRLCFWVIAEIHGCRLQSGPNFLRARLQSIDSIVGNVHVDRLHWICAHD